MPLQVLPKESAMRADASARQIIEYLQIEQDQLGLQNAVVFYNFPLFREEEKLLVAELVVASPKHGVALITTAPNGISTDTQRLDGAFNQIFARLIKYPRLRIGRAKLKFQVDAFVWVPEGPSSEDVVVGLQQLHQRFDGLIGDELESEAYEEMLSVLDGSKALTRAKERKTDSFPSTSRIATIARLEEEIRRFDRDQRVAYMTEVAGLQRIRGLAGSGKTVVLALKAALTAIREPDAKIAVTFYTKSLYQHIRQLITRFYRMHEDRDPDWTRLQVLHAWGGASADGFYYKAAQRFGHQPISYGQAVNASRQQPFGYVCERLLSDPAVEPVYDYVFVDEAQDFPPSFMQLALRLAREEKLVIAYDAFQTIFDVEVPTAANLFAIPADGSGDLVFDEDIILHKCYRNPREILVCAHAIGFGIYGKRIAQILESADHWQDFGYSVIGNLTPGAQTQILRPEENSPSSVSKSNKIDDIITCHVLNDMAMEVAHVVSRIVAEISTQGVSPEDILVICADDRNAASYFKLLRASLLAAGIKSNNLQDDSYGIRDFQQDGAVTLSTIYKAKGNEAYSVYIVGIDAIFYEPSPRDRNRAFTAMTRAKGWLYITGIGASAQLFAEELQAAKGNFPNLVFKYPTPEELVFMKRDLVEIDPEEVDDEIDRLGKGLDPEEMERILRRKLRQVQARKRIQKRIK